MLVHVERISSFWPFLSHLQSLMRLEFRQKPQKPFREIESLSEPCVKRYGLVFKNKLSRQCHNSFHIHYRGINPSKAKTPLR